MLNIEFNDFELEFLKLLDVELKGDHFVNVVTGDEYNYSELQDNSNVAVSKIKYIFVSSRGDVIEFKREKSDRQMTNITVDYIYYDYHHYAQEKVDVENGQIVERTVGMDSEMKYDSNNPSSKKISKDTSNISARYINYSEYFYVTVFANYKDYYKTIDITEMACSLSAIYPNAEHRVKYKPFSLDDIVKSDKPLPLSRDNYILQLTNDINSKFSDNNNMRLFYLKMIPFLLKVFEESLKYPYKYHDAYFHRLDGRREALKKAYTGTILEEKLKEVDDMYYYLDNYFPNLDINKDSNKELKKTKEE